MLIMLKQREVKILSTLIESDKPITAYKIAKRTGEHGANIRDGIHKLVQVGVVMEHNSERTTSYSPHPVLTCKDCIQSIAEHISEIADLIDGHEKVEPEGTKMIFDFIMRRVQISNIYNGDKRDSHKPDN